MLIVPAFNDGILYSKVTTQAGMLSVSWQMFTYQTQDTLATIAAENMAEKEVDPSMKDAKHNL